MAIITDVTSGFYAPTKKTYLLEDKRVEELFRVLENLGQEIPGIGQRDKEGNFSNVSRMEKNEVNEALEKLSSLIKRVTRDFRKYNLGIQRALGVKRPEETYTQEEFLDPLYKLKKQLEYQRSEINLADFLDLGS